MSRWGGPRGSADDMAYGELPQRWDRDRFERLGGGGGPQRSFQEDYRYTERDRPGRQDIAVTDRIDERGPRGNYEERDRYVEHDRFTPGGRRKRTDKELFGDVDPREIADLALTPYRSRGATQRELDIDQRSRGPPRPGLMRRQSSLDTFDRRPIPRYERETIPIPTYTPVPLPLPRQDRYGRDEYRDYEPEDYREVEIQRERSVHRRGPKSAKSVKSSKAKSTKRSSSSSSSDSFEKVESVHESRHGGPTSFHESFHESVHGGGQSFHESFHESVHGGATSVSESIQQTEKKFKKGKTRMPKRLVRREAIMDLGYPFDEEEDFFVLRIALEKEQIDEVMRISETYKNGEKKTVYKYDGRIDEVPVEPQREHEEVLRTEWINPPTVVGDNRSVSRHEHLSPRQSSPDGSDTTRRARSTHQSRAHRRSEPGNGFFEERRTVIEEQRSPPPPPPPIAPPPQEYYERKTVVEERDSFSPSHQIRSPSNHGTLVLQEREYRSDRDIQGEISRLEAERRALRLEREAEERRDMAVRIRERPEEDYQLVEYRSHSRPAREVLEITERERSPPRNVVRVEKDRKGRMALVRSQH